MDIKDAERKRSNIIEIVEKLREMEKQVQEQERAEIIHNSIIVNRYKNFRVMGIPRYHIERKKRKIILMS